MINIIDVVNYCVVSGGLITAIIGLFISYSVPYMRKAIHRYFKVIFILIIVYTISTLLTCFSLDYFAPKGKTLTYISLFYESWSSSILMPVLTAFILTCANEKISKNIFFYISCVIWTIYTVMLIITQFTTEIYYITDDNVYYRGPLYPILLVPPVILMLLNLVIIFIYRKKLSKTELRGFIIYLTVPLICMLVQMTSYGLLLIVIGTSFAAVIMLLLILNDQMTQYLKQREENEKAQASIMILQMRPHFIYNTMTSIYYLCKQDPKKAMDTIDNFTNYLRKNFSAIATDGTISFNEELEHVQAYLAVEQTRFEGQLFVEYDIPYTMFRIPPLTLQPIVENSVKYGVDPELNPLHISITTRETNSCIVISVTDDGPGFNVEIDPSSSDGREPHIALNNIRERLDIMCHGTLSITPREAGGTVVVIRIPK